MYQFDEETDKSHDAEADRGRNRNLLELAPVGLGAALDQPDRVLGEGTARLVDLGNLVHDCVLEREEGKYLFRFRLMTWFSVDVDEFKAKTFLSVFV